MGDQSRLNMSLDTIRTDVSAVCARNERRHMNTSKGGRTLDYEGFGSCLSPTRTLPDHALAKDRLAVRTDGARRTVLVCIQDTQGIGYEWCRQLLARGDNVLAAVDDPAGDKGLKHVVMPHRENGSGAFKYNTIEPIPMSSLGELQCEYLVMTADPMPETDGSMAGAMTVLVEDPMAKARRCIPALLQGSSVNGRRAMVYTCNLGLGQDILNMRVAAAAQHTAWGCLSLQTPELCFLMMQPSQEASVESGVADALRALDRATFEHTGNVISL